MQLNDAQRATLAAHIRATMAAEVSAGNHALIAEKCNASSTTQVWKGAVPPDEYHMAIDPAEVASLTPGQMNVWWHLTGFMTLALNPADVDVSGAMQGFFGPLMPKSMAKMLGAMRRPATVAEALFAIEATPPGNTAPSGTPENPKALTVEGRITPLDVARALGG